MPPIRYVSLADLKPWPGAARTHSKKQIRQIAESIRRFGFINPIVIDEDQQILAGHGRVEAARTMKLEEVPALRIDTMSEAEKRAYVIADNKLALNARWNETFLGNELERLLSQDLHFDIGIAGFSVTDAIHLIDESIASPTYTPASGNAESTNTSRSESRNLNYRELYATKDCDAHNGGGTGRTTSNDLCDGDIWGLGGHRVLCVHPLNIKTIGSLFPDRRVKMVVFELTEEKTSALELAIQRRLISILAVSTRSPVVICEPDRVECGHLIEEWRSCNHGAVTKIASNTHEGLTANQTHR